MAQAIEAIRSAGVFDERFYLDTYMAADPMLKLVDPVSHYLAVGCGRGFRPSRDFDAGSYIGHHPELGRGGLNPLLHFALAERAQRPLGRAVGEAGEGTSRGRSRKRVPDFSGLGRPWPAGTRPSLDVIVPVHSGFTQTLEAIRAILVSRNKTPFEVIVIDDKSPDAELVRQLQLIAGRGLITFLRNRRNLGFAGTVNRGLRLHPRRDVILLNSDTKVHGNWVDRLSAHARPGVATVTPFSNNASLCSFPRIFEANSLPPGTTARTLDRLCARLNRRQSVEVPSGIGFCMYVTRAAARAIGEFDEETFGRGYGEDNDYCVRALKLGFRNLHAQDVFVFHEGGVSFGVHGHGTVSTPLSALMRKHPSFARKLRRFAVEDPALLARQRLELALLTRGRKQADILLADSSGEVPRARSNRIKAGLTLVLVPEAGGRSFRIRTLHDVSSLPNLSGLSRERLGQLLKDLSAGRMPVVLKLRRNPRLGPDARTQFREMGLSEIIGHSELPGRSEGRAFTATV